MTIRVDCIAIDAHDPVALARWWGELLGWQPEVDAEDEVTLWPPDGQATPLLFLGVGDAKVAKNRLHLDLRPEDRDAEVARAEAMGAVRVDIGQGEQTWVVLADPEGNEFCILRALTEQERAETA